MAIRPIKIYPEPILLEKAIEVRDFNSDLARLVEDMIETMDAAPGIGLAAPQIGVGQRIFVCDISEERNERHVFINPVIDERLGETRYEEGCLSLPFIFGEVERAERVKVRAYDVNGEEFELEADGLLAICIQHEFDHLEGVLFIDYFTRLKRERLITQMKKKIVEHQAKPS